MPATSMLNVPLAGHIAAPHPELDEASPGGGVTSARDPPSVGVATSGLLPASVIPVPPDPPDPAAPEPPLPPVPPPVPPDVAPPVPPEVAPPDPVVVVVVVVPVVAVPVVAVPEVVVLPPAPAVPVVVPPPPRVPLGGPPAVEQPIAKSATHKGSDLRQNLRMLVPIPTRGEHDERARLVSFA